MDAFPGPKKRGNYIRSIEKLSTITKIYKFNEFISITADSLFKFNAHNPLTCLRSYRFSTFPRGGHADRRTGQTDTQTDRKDRHADR